MNEYSALRILSKKLVEHKKQVQDIQTKNYFVGAVLMDKQGRILSLGFNSFYKTHPYQKKLSDSIKVKNKERQIYIHAEVSALVKCNSVPHTLIIARIGMDESIYRLAKPCPLCQEAIRQSSIKKVYYTNNNGELVLFNSNEPEGEEE